MEPLIICCEFSLVYVRHKLGVIFAALHTSWISDVMIRSEITLKAKCKMSCNYVSVSFIHLLTFSLLLSFVQVNKLKRDLACMRQELLYKEQGFETLKE